MLRDAVNLFIGTLIGSLFSLWLTVYYEERWTGYHRRHLHLRRTRAIRESWIPVHGDGPVALASRRTRFYLVEGDGETVLESQYLTVVHRPERVALPAEVEYLRTAAEESLSAGRTDPDTPVASWNGTTLAALRHYQSTRAGDAEHVSLQLHVSSNDYATFMATVLGLDEPIPAMAKYRTDSDVGTTSLRDLYFPDSGHDAVLAAVRRPIPFLANGIGVGLLAFTNDDKAVLIRRRKASRARPGQRDVSVIEGLHTVHDSPRNGAIDPYLTAVRGCREELGVEVDTHDVLILGFGVDMIYYQWGLLGSVELRLPSYRLLEQASRNARDRWEGRIETISADPMLILEQLAIDGTWDTALVTAYLALCKRYGIRETNRAVERVFAEQIRYGPGPTADPAWWLRSRRNRDSSR